MTTTESASIKNHIRVLWSREKIQQPGPVEFLNYGHSMKPLICEGDLITIVRCRGGACPRPSSSRATARVAPTTETRRTTYEQLRIGDIILVRSPRLNIGLIMHRVIAKRRQNGNSYLVTQGDANPYPDPPIYHEDILGKVISVKRNNKIVRLDRGLYYELGKALGHFAFLTRWINRSGLRRYLGLILNPIFPSLTPYTGCSKRER